MSVHYLLRIILQTIDSIPTLFQQVYRKTSKNASTTDSFHIFTDKTVIDETAKSNKDKESGTTTKLKQTPKSSGAKPSSQSEQKPKQKPEKPTVAKELADSSSSDGEIGKCHLSQPKAVFRHMQSLASKHGELRTGEE